MGSRVGAGGQTTLETTLLVGGVVAALVGMSLYLQRAYQGYVLRNMSSHGDQFDPRERYDVRQEIRRYVQDQDIEIAGGQAAVDMAGFNASIRFSGATIPPGTLASKVKVTTEWDTEATTEYDVEQQ